MFRSRLLHFVLSLVVIALAPPVWAGTAAFDLSGPRMEMSVTRAGETLPISQVPNLQPQDRLWIHLVLPPGQTVHYLMVVAFLRGSTNPPPDNWFVKVETWDKRVRREGVTVTVPQDAQQVLLLLAPRTGGDFSTLRSAVRGKPGAFVRASQDLNRASLDRSRLDEYLSAIQRISDADPKSLHEASVLLARSLNIRLDKQCFDKPSEQQAPCLMQNTDGLVLEDGHSQSMVSALTSGPGSDLIGTLSTAKAAGAGAYSPYVGAVMDMARIMERLHTAEYQYIPALSIAKQDMVDLKLNNPPSFRKPKSVMVAGLPAVEAAQLPPLRPVDSKQTFCLQKPGLVLPAEGAPLVFSTKLAHRLVLELKGKLPLQQTQERRLPGTPEAGQRVELPAKADPVRGGLAIDTKLLPNADLGTDLIGTVRGQWGFQTFDGPSFRLQSAQPRVWVVPAADKSALIVGREDVLHLEADDAVCVSEITVKDKKGQAVKAEWKLVKPDELELKLPLKDAAAGPMSIMLKKYGLSKADELSLLAYSEPGHLDGLVIHAGDRHSVLQGTRLDEVASLELNGMHFLPAGLARAGQKDQLRLAAQTAAGDPLQVDEKVKAKVALKDGRVLEVQTTVGAPRPKVKLISKSVQGPARSAVRLATEDDLPQDGRLSFFLQAEVPQTFPRGFKIEVATEDGSSQAVLSAADGSLTFQDPHTVMAVLDPLKNFGPSVFGPLRFRPVDAGGAAGDWQPLTKLVRIPTLKEVRCPDSPDKQCTLFGTNLFLIDSVASDAQFTRSVPVPLGFASSTLSVPRPNGTLLYLKLRDDPAVINMAALPVLPEE